MLSPQQARIHPFKVVPSLPEPLEPLLTIARNLWWAWHPEAVELFMRVDGDLWRQTKHNPVRLLGSCPQDRLEELARDESFLSAIKRVEEELNDHLKTDGWFQRNFPDANDCCVAYFCAEFGLTECLQVYSGGLGILAGDHLKSASELAVPLVAVGLLYRNGYFQQYLNADGWQQEFYPELDFTNLPIRPVHDADGHQLTVSVDLPGRKLNIAVWEAKVGRTRLFLLDTNLPTNEGDDRGITSQLYGGDMELRIKQELVLGIGGLRALTAMQIKPSVLHMNEGHAAFLALEHIRVLIEKYNLTFDEARQSAAASHVFTTHTPVPAGIDRFPPEMIQRYFKDYHSSLKLDMEGLLALGRENVANRNEFFSMAVLAIRTSDGANGVSKLHGEVSRDMWANIWPKLPNEEVPIGHVTNGVHARTWLSPDLIWLFDRYLSRNWKFKPNDQSVWDGIKQIPDEELWRIHGHRRQRLVHWLRRTHKEQMERRGASSAELGAIDELFDHKALTIGFARRFATYKRANLLFRDPERLMRILGSKDRPVQIVIAGKAHPADTQGKELIRQIVHFARENGASTRVVFIENYNMHVARYLVQGVDVWLNTPRRGMEASGTSGMKAALNGVLNCSILDGWWDEAWAKDVGWAIGRGEAYSNYDYQDQVESQSLYDLLEKQIVPMYYDRDGNGLPRMWIKWMKNTMRAMSPVYNTNRMVADYVQKYYLPAHRRTRKLTADGLKGGVELSHYISNLHQHWGQVRIQEINANTGKPLGVRQPMNVIAKVNLGDLAPADVRVQIYYGPLDVEGRIQGGTCVDMSQTNDLGAGVHEYTGSFAVDNSGKHGMAVRVIPGNPAMATPFIPGVIAWDNEPERARTPDRTPVPAEV
ncbi:MAG: alpha-glucan family phosphorylase [Planctomycetes bacterium]|nr:alpha-glucan family phosphorylase [Planctomycetota bacterium]